MPAQSTSRSQLEKLRDRLQTDLDVISRALALLTGDVKQRKTRHADDMIRSAVRMDDQRRGTNDDQRPKRTRRKAPQRRYYNPVVKKQRIRTRARLAQFDKDEPRRGTGRVIGSLLRNGYLAAAGKDEQGRRLYVRTDKEFQVEPPAPAAS